MGGKWANLPESANITFSDTLKLLTVTIVMFPVFPGLHSERGIYAGRPQTMHVLCDGFLLIPSFFLFKRHELFFALPDLQTILMTDVSEML